MSRKVGAIGRAAALAGCSLLGAALCAGCPAKMSRTTTTRPAPRKVADKPTRSFEFKGRYWRDELASYHSIPQLWNAMNRYYDSLGRALFPRYPTHPATVPRRRVTPRRPGDTGVVRPSPPRIDRPPVTPRARAPLCRRACNHVRAICYAARRICQIAGRLRDYRAQNTCKRATARCADARRVARRRCRSCD